MDLLQLREEHERLTLEREMAVLKVETAAINGANFPGMHISDVERGNQQLQEAWGDMVPMDEYPTGSWDGASNPRASGLWSTIGAQLGDRSFGQDEQVFTDEIEHARIRAIGRLLCNKSVNARAVQNNLTSYILSTGFSYKVVPEEGETPKPELIKAVQAIIKQVQADNKWWKRERQLFRRSRRDGEFFTALYHVGGGRTQLRTIEPEQVSAPDDPDAVVDYFGLPDLPWSWSFGIATDDDDMEKVHGYHVKWRTAEGRDTAQWFPESNMVHCKLNVDENIKRGLSDYYAVYEQLIDSAKLSGNTIKGHAIMAAIAFIREHATGVTQAQVESQQANSAWARYQVSTRTEGKRTQISQRFHPGTVIDVGKDTQYKSSPMAEQGVGLSMIAVNEAVLQIAATNWCMPGYMITGSTGDTAYAASLVVESPFVKYAESEQIDHAEEFVEIHWKAIQIAYAAGQLDQFGMTFEEIKATLKIKVDPPVVASRDRNVETNRRKILCDSGILSEETWSAEESYDRERELKRGAERKQTEAPFAGGDQPGKSVQGADKKKAEGSLREAAELLWRNYPGGDSERCGCVTEHLGPGNHPSGSDQDVHGGNEMQGKQKKPVLKLPEGATLEIRKPRGSKLYLPVRVRFSDGSTTTNWEDTLRSYGVTIVDWENPKVVSIDD